MNEATGVRDWWPGGSWDSLGLLAEMLPLGTMHSTLGWAQGLRETARSSESLSIAFPVGPDAQPLGWHPDPCRGNGYLDLTQSFIYTLILTPLHPDT